MKKLPGQMSADEALAIAVRLIRGEAIPASLQKEVVARLDKMAESRRLAAESQQNKRRLKRQDQA